MLVDNVPMASQDLANPSQINTRGKIALPKEQIQVHFSM